MSLGLPGSLWASLGLSEPCWAYLPCVEDMELAILKGCGGMLAHCCLIVQGTRGTHGTRVSEGSQRNAPAFVTSGRVPGIPLNSFFVRGTRGTYGTRVSEGSQRNAPAFVTSGRSECRVVSSVGHRSSTLFVQPPLRTLPKHGTVENGDVVSL